MSLETAPYLTLSNTMIQSSVPLSDKTWFKTGGNARFYSEPTTPDHFSETVVWANKHQVPVFVLGEGANILISDDGFDGLVIRPQIMNLEIVKEDSESALVKAGAGVPFSKLINFCLEQNLGGLHEFSGIPGTVGGSVFINIHYFEFLLSAFLTEATVIHHQTGSITTVDNAWFRFKYNYSTLHENNHYLLDATFRVKKLIPIESAYAQGRRDEMIRHRARRYPTARTCGSFFRNFYEHEVQFESNGKKMIYVAYYFDKLGFKGQLAVGDALVSHLHANMIVNKDKATSGDIIALARKMQEAVKNHFNILPHPECRLIGFKEYPLLED